MEKSPRLGSNDEVQQRRKKKGALPLAVFLSFNDRDVHPHCPNASNRYHKCGRHCLDKISPGNKLLDKGRPGGSSSESDNMTIKKEVNAICPNVSNPFHKCTDYCFEKSVDKLHALKEPGIKKKMLVTADESGVNLGSKYASNTYNKFDELCSESSPFSDHSKDVMKPKEQEHAHNADTRVNSECKNALNPYHICADYCFQEILGRELKSKILKERKKKVNIAEITDIKPKTLKERQKIVNIRETAGVNPHCKFASNRFHKCAEYCFQNVEEHIFDDAQFKTKKGDNRKERLVDHLRMEKSENFDNIEGTISGYNFTDSSKGITIHLGTNESVSVEKESRMIELSDTQPLRIDASDLFQEWAKYCSLKAMEDNDNEDTRGKASERDEQRIRRDKR